MSHASVGAPAIRKLAASPASPQCSESYRVRARSQVVVGDALRDQVTKARDIQAARVFTAAFISCFRQDPAAAAAEAGMDEAGLRQLIDGTRTPR